MWSWHKLIDHCLKPAPTSAIHFMAVAPGVRIVSGLTISLRLTALLSDLCIGERGHRQIQALELIDEVRRMEAQNQFLKHRVVELDIQLAAVNINCESME